MNSEELELSLRSEFEAHINSVLADVQTQVADFQSKIDAELEKHRSQLNEAFKDFSSRLAGQAPLDKAFTETVVEHLRLARDDGARITAAAMAEAEAMGSGSVPSASISVTRDAINDISRQTSQSAILHTLVSYAEQFCPRGVFFIVRNEHFVGWQALGSEVMAGESAVRELNFPVTSDTVLSDAVRTLTAAERTSQSVTGDGVFLDPLGFNRPPKMYAIPLVARGRGVAALYVDGGKSGQPVNIEALEMFVRVASLTVELLASNQVAYPQTADAAQPVHQAEAAPEVPPQQVMEDSPASEYQIETAGDWQAETESAPMEEVVPEYQEIETAGQWQAETQSTPIEEDIPEYQVETASTWQAEQPTAVVEEPVNEYQIETLDGGSYDTIEATEIQVEPEPVVDTPEHSADFAFRPSVEDEPAPQEDESTHQNEPVFSNGNSHVAVDHTVEVESPRTQPGTRRLDLPIEVAEAERGTHTKARRFARLLVSEIKLYNEDKVKEGRQAGDLYDRLREAIDRSREMYDKRVEPPVSSRFDYFHYELVNDLAEGDAARLGSSYPGTRA